MNDRFFEPGQVKRLECFAPAHRRVELHQTIGIGHQFDIVAHRVAHRPHARDIFGRIVAAVLGAGAARVAFAADVDPADLNLKPALAARYPVFGRGRQFVATVGAQTECNVSGDRFLCAAEQSPHRCVIQLALDVPQRHVDGADGIIPHPPMGTGVELPQHLMHQAFVLQWVFAFQKW